MVSIKKVLITGGLGFIGSFLAEKCVDKGYDVTILSRTGSKIGNIGNIRKSVNVIIKDVGEIGRGVAGFDCIFHLAGSTDNYAIMENEPYKDIRLNCTNTIALLEACKKYNPKARIVFGSTFFVNGRPSKLPVTPETPCLPLGLYGATRLTGEHFCRIYHNIFGLDVVTVRFTNVFGPREQMNNPKKAGFNYLIGLAIKGMEIPLYENGNFFRDYIYVEDAADACIIVAQKGKAGKIYYIGRGEFVKFKKLVDIVVKETGAKVRVISPPDFHKKVGIRDYVCNNSELKKIGWKPRVTLEEGIRRTISYCKGLGK